MENYVVLFLQRFEIRVYLLQSGAVKRMYCTCTYIHTYINTNIHVHIRSIALATTISQNLAHIEAAMLTFV